ncbi:MAG: elongation factor 1-beta [Nanoarchaeota archaeon]
MTGIVAVIVKILPDSVEANLDQIEKSAKQVLEKEGAKNISFEQEEIAFGLKSIKVKFAWPEEKSTDIIDNSLAKIKNVTSAQIEDYRRAFG